MVTPFLLIIRMTWQKVYLQFYFLTYLETKCRLSVLNADFWFISHSFNGYLLQSSFWLLVKVCSLTTLRVYSHLYCLVRLNRTQVHFAPWCRSFGQVWIQQLHSGADQTTVPRPSWRGVLGPIPSKLWYGWMDEPKWKINIVFGPHQSKWTSGSRNIWTAQLCLFLRWSVLSYLSHSMKHEYFKYNDLSWFKYLFTYAFILSAYSIWIDFEIDIIKDTPHQSQPLSLQPGNENVLLPLVRKLYWLIN